MYRLLEKTELVDSSSHIVFNDMTNSQKYSSFFDNTFLKTNDDQEIPEYFDFVATISDSEKFSRIHGKINSTKDSSFPELDFEWNIAELSHLNKTRISYTIYDTNVSGKKTPSYANHRNVFIAGLISAVGIGFATISDAYASTATSAVSSSIPTASSTVAPSTVSTKSPFLSKPILAAMLISVVAATGGGLTIGDAYYSDPLVEYSTYPKELPAELFGTAVTVNNVYSTDDKSEIINYDCNNDLIVYGLDHTFDCVAENSLGNKETITTTISVIAPNDKLNADVSECISRHFMLSDNLTKKYPYLSNLPNVSPSAITNYKNTHIKLMDDYFENRDYVNAKEHATIVLKYFAVNDPQALSTLGNIIRDQDRTNLSNVECAKALHSTPVLYNTVWGKLSLAEDYHVLGNYEKAASLSSVVIDEYNDPVNQTIHEITHMNALLIKANALFRDAMEKRSDDVEDVKNHYLMAHSIQESYDSWFGLGNLDRYQENFEEALGKYEKAREFAVDTTEIDEEISIVSSYHLN